MKHKWLLCVSSFFLACFVLFGSEFAFYRIKNNIIRQRILDSFATSRQIYDTTVHAILPLFPGQAHFEITYTDGKFWSHTAEDRQMIQETKAVSALFALRGVYPYDVLLADREEDATLTFVRRYRAQTDRLKQVCLVYDAKDPPYPKAQTILTEHWYYTAVLILDRA